MNAPVPLRHTLTATESRSLDRARLGGMLRSFYEAHGFAAAITDTNAELQALAMAVRAVGGSTDGWVG